MPCYVVVPCSPQTLCELVTQFSGEAIACSPGERETSPRLCREVVPGVQVVLITTTLSLAALRDEPAHSPKRSRASDDDCLLKLGIESGLARALPSSRDGRGGRL